MQPKSDNGSIRPIQTVTQLANYLKLPIRQEYRKKQVSSLIAKMMQDPALDGAVVVSWEHNFIIAILEELGISTPPAPAVWPKEVYDWALIVDLTPSGKVLRFEKIHQNLPMDSSQVGTPYNQLD